MLWAELRLVLAITLFGILLETGFMGAGLITFSGTPVLGVLPPVWVWALWLGFASLPNGSLTWLQGRPGLQMLLGLVFGPLAYWTGAKMGAAEMPDGRRPVRHRTGLGPGLPGHHAAGRHDLAPAPCRGGS